MTQEIIPVSLDHVYLNKGECGGVDSHVRQVTNQVARGIGGRDQLRSVYKRATDHVLARTGGTDLEGGVSVLSRCSHL